MKNLFSGQKGPKMKLRVKLFATLRNGRFDIKDMELPDECKVLDLIKLLKIDQKDAAIIFINGIHGDFDSLLKENDEVSIFPPVGGG